MCFEKILLLDFILVFLGTNLIVVRVRHLRFGDFDLACHSGYYKGKLLAARARRRHQTVFRNSDPEFHFDYFWEQTIGRGVEPICCSKIQILDVVLVILGTKYWP
jgi:hypothetical protein